MGCNTSQELKTKDGTNAAMGNNDASKGDGNMVHNGEQNGNNLDGSRSGSGSARISGTGGGLDANKSALSSHSNHSKSNSITSNGDASANAKHGKDFAGFEHLKPQQHHGLFNGDAGLGLSGSGSSGGNASGRKQCEKAEIDELNDMDLGEDEAKAAVKIQAAFRGHQVRTTMKKSETKSSSSTSSNAASTNNQNQKSSDAKNGAAAAAAAADPTKAELEAEFDPNDKELCDAALKIQSTFRGHLARKLVNKEDEDVDIQEITKKVAEELDIDLTDPELNKAATKIQASFRGHKTRKDTPH